MDSMRDLLRLHLARSLEALSPQERLAAAWPVACGKAMAARGSIAGFEDGIVRVEVQDPVWLEQMRSMRALLESQLAAIAGVGIVAIHFQVKGLEREKRR